VEHTLTLRIVLEKPPAGVDFGVQQGKGNDYQTIQKQRSAGGDLRFEITIRARPGTGGPNFLGPFVQGPTGGRFVYIDIGTCAGQTGTPWSRRLKIPLLGIPWEAVARARANAPSVFEARLVGTGRDGGPSCGTARPFAGWETGARG
jgi:hypothetical protein